MSAKAGQIRLNWFADAHGMFTGVMAATGK